MNAMRWTCAVLAAAAMVLAGCETAAPKAEAVAEPPAEVVQPTYLYEVMRYLYRWKLEDSEIERIVPQKHFAFWVSRLELPLDADDHSIFAEIVLPQAGMSVRVKKSDYRVEENNLQVKSERFMIVDVTRMEAPARPPAGAKVVDVDMQDMREFLFRTRSQRDYPDAKLLEHLRGSVRKVAVRDSIALPAGEQIIHLAPLSPIANEMWVYWETGNRLLYFSSDVDLANESLWELAPPRVQTFDLETQVVVSQEEAGSSNQYLSRYQVGRTLFNCMVLGERLTFMPPPKAATQP